MESFGSPVTFEVRNTLPVMPARSIVEVIGATCACQTSASNTPDGQLSRLLNVCDGLLGQGLNVIVLFATNAPLGVIHPAVLCPGRCLATVEFGPFSATEVAARGTGIDAREMTLAELTAAEGGVPDVLGATSEQHFHSYL